jgi:phosphatidate phosphatase LPIN
MVVAEGHNCVFPDGGLRPEEDEWEHVPLRLGKNEMRFQLTSAPNAFFCANLYVLLSDTLAIVCDIDGTLTRSDIFGYGAHKLGYDSAHRGACEAFNAIHDSGYLIIYLSARPITKADKTRELLHTLGTTGANPSSVRMPDGPLITTAERTFTALVRTLRSSGGKGADAFKLLALQEIQDAFTPPWALVGAPPKKMLLGGFGNRPTGASMCVNVCMSVDSEEDQYVCVEV